MMFIRRKVDIPILVGTIASLLCFIFLAISVWNHELSLVWDIPILERIHAVHQERLDITAYTVTQLAMGSTIFAIAGLISLGFAWFKQWRSLSYFFVTILGSGILNLIFKVIFHRVRPALWDSSLPELDYSFPSGHAMMSMTLVVALVILVKPSHWRSLLLFCGLIFVLAIGWTRLYLGVHYPSDILGGWSLAIAWALAVSLVINVDSDIKGNAKLLNE